MLQQQFEKWLMAKGISSYRNYTSRIKKIEDFEGNIDEHFKNDSCTLLLWKFQYTKEDKLNKLELRHNMIIDKEYLNMLSLRKRH